MKREYGCVTREDCPTFMSRGTIKPTVCPYCGSHGLQVMDTAVDEVVKPDDAPNGVDMTSLNGSN